MQDLLDLYRSPAWEQHKAFVLEHAHNVTDFGAVRLMPYTHNESPKETAIRNELFRFFQQGLVYSLYAAEQQVAKTDAMIADLKAEIQAQKDLRERDEDEES